ncbi:MAG: leucyl/phenylalanyl-tRNA--protein transferase, partial [Bacteroidia bacterium]
LNSYINLYHNKMCHSIECYDGNTLIGGLYGVHIGGCFFGESMFHLVTDASKIALVFLVEFLREHDFLLLDTQYLNPHIAQFGAYEITHQEYVKLLRRAIAAS